MVTHQKLEALLATFGPAPEIRWYRADYPFDSDGFLDKPLHYETRFEIHITVTHERTIWIRVYPAFSGHRFNLDSVSDPAAFKKKLLQFSYHNFFFWGADDNLDVFAGYQFTLGSAFQNTRSRK